MIQWKIQLHRMHHRLVKYFCLIVLCLLCGCTKQYWTQKRWFTEVSLKGGFCTQESTALNDLQQFGIIDVFEYSLENSLNMKTVMETFDAMLQDESYKISDLMEQYSLDEKDVLTSEQAVLFLDVLMEEVNSFDEKGQSVIYLTEPVKVEVTESMGDWITCEQILHLHDLIEIDGTVYEVIEVDQLWFRIKEADYDNVREIDVSGSMNLNLDDAQITVRNEVVELNEVLRAGTPAFKLSKSFDFQGFKIRFSTSSDSIHIYASKKMSNGLPVFVQFDINEIQCDFKWKADKDSVYDAGMKVSYETSLTSGLRTSDYEDRILDFSKVHQNQLFSSLRNAFVPQKDCIEATLEIAEIQLPFPEFPACVLKMKVLLHLYASGRAEISFEGNHVIGFEKINDQIRFIHESEKDSQVQFRASGKASTKLQFLISILSKDCMDASAEVGIEGEAVTKLAMTETLEVIDADIPYELAEELSKSNEHLMACADLDAHWLLNLVLNSRKSLLGSLGLGKTISLINESNGSLFGKTVHLENFQIVDRCTRTRRSTPLPALNVTTDRIELKNYLLVMDENSSGKIVISSLPEGATLSDVVFSSNDPQIAEVDSSGCVTGIQSGHTTVLISLKDGTHEVQCSIFVR